jgi:hypothetical protein
MNPLIVPLPPAMLLLNLSSGWFTAMPHIEQPGSMAHPPIGYC